MGTVTPEHSLPLLPLSSFASSSHLLFSFPSSLPFFLFLLSFHSSFFSSSIPPTFSSPSPPPLPLSFPLCFLPLSSPPPLLFITSLIITESHVDVAAYIKLLTEGMRSEQPGGENRLSDTLRLMFRHEINSVSSSELKSPESLVTPHAAALLYKHHLRGTQPRRGQNPALTLYLIKQKEAVTRSEAGDREVAAVLRELVMSECNTADWCSGPRRQRRAAAASGVRPHNCRHAAQARGPPEDSVLSQN